MLKDSQLQYTNQRPLERLEHVKAAVVGPLEVAKKRYKSENEEKVRWVPEYVWSTSSMPSAPTCHTRVQLCPRARSKSVY